MGRLVKAFSDNDGHAGSRPDEAQFLREAEALAVRIQQELQVEAGEPAHGTASAAGQGSADHQTESMGTAVSNSAGRQLGRDVYSELDGEWARFGSSPEADGLDPDVLRIFNGPRDAPLPEALETTESNSNAEVIRRELMEELVQEQSRWTERHAMQVRSIEEQTRQLAQVDAEVKVREDELDQRERELDVRARELALKAQAEVRRSISCDWELTHKDMDRLASEARTQADRAAQFEKQLIDVRREYTVELDSLKGQLSIHDDSRADRAKSVIEECDQRMAELTAQRAAWQAEQSRRSEELALERLEQRDEFRQQNEKLQAEVTTQREEFTKECDVTIERLDAERREWNEKFTREQDELLDLKRVVESEAEQVHANLAREKSEWATHQEHMRVALRQEQASAQELVNERMTDADRLIKEHTANFENLTKEFESERAAWYRERGREAAILQVERSELETEADRLRAERSLVEVERTQWVGKLEQQRTENEESLRESWRNHQVSLQQAEQESTTRQRVLAEDLQQHKDELAARMQQADHEIRSARELCAKQIAQDKERFSQTCATHEAELERARADLNVQRQLFEREKLDFNDEMSRNRKQTEQERSVLRNSLSQMDAQLRVAATSLLPGMTYVDALHDQSNAPVSLSQIAVSVECESVELELDADSSSVDGVAHTDEPVEDQLQVEAQESGEESIAEEQGVVDAQLVAWEPGKDATLVETPSSDLIRRFDSPSETGGVSGLGFRPRIASYGVFAHAATDVDSAEIVYASDERESEWVGTVDNQADEMPVEVTGEPQIEGRRQALETYRSKLSSLQDQLRQLSGPPTDQFADGSSPDETV